MIERMNSVVFLVLASLGIAISCSASLNAEDQFVDDHLQQYGPIAAFEQNHKMSKGLSILAYDPIWQNPKAALFRFDTGSGRENDFEKIRKAGFNTLRLGFRPYRRSVTETALPELTDEMLDTMELAVGQGLKYGFTVIIDLHEMRLCPIDPDLCKEHQILVWTKVAERFKGYPNRVLFELFNEPDGKLTPPLWNELLLSLLKVVRITNPYRNIIIGTAHANIIKHLEDLTLPDHDRHLIVGIHYFSPGKFTHQSVPWVADLKNLKGVRWGTPADVEQVKRDFEIAKKWSDRNSRPIWLGEFACYEGAPPEDRVAWTRVVRQTAEQNGFSWAYFQFNPKTAGKPWFTIYWRNKDKWDEPILAALMDSDPTPAGGP